MKDAGKQDRWRGGNGSSSNNDMVLDPDDLLHAETRKIG
jgi:hypothetical protein